MANTNRLVINQCSRHRFFSVSIEDENGGTRVTPSKCCGSWSTLREWKLSPDEWLEIAQLATAAGGSFQENVGKWMELCFPPDVRINITERGDRVMEEMIELLQSHGYDRNRIATLVDYVYNRPPGRSAQEVGGVMVTLAAYCNAARIDMQLEGHNELRRISYPETITKIQAKQAAKAALPFDTAAPSMPLLQFHPIETAPKDNKVPLLLARFDDKGELQELDFNGSWESDHGIWELSQVCYYWASANGYVEEPTHWAYQNIKLEPQA